jgi:hypothetical protein
MNALALNSDDPYGVRSLSLEEIITQAPPLPIWRRAIRFMRIAVMAWGVISLGAVAGMAAYYLNGEPDTALLVSEGQSPFISEDQSSPPNAVPAKPKPDRVAVALNAAPSAEAVFAPATLPDLSGLELSPPLTDARLPRPRPDEPIITGSLGPPRYDPDYAPTHRRRIANPCTTLRNLGAPIRCGNQARVYSPPPPPPVPEYYPRPYQPPLYRN